MENTPPKCPPNRPPVTQKLHPTCRRSSSLSPRDKHFPLDTTPISTPTPSTRPLAKHATLFPDDLRRFMSYNVNGSCPDDELLAQKLLLKGCEPLPRRRCSPAAPSRYEEPYPLPESYWTTPPDSSVLWTAYSCKNYSCLVNRKRNQKGFDDCKDSEDLEGAEKTQRTAKESPVGVLDFAIDEVLATRKPVYYLTERHNAPTK
ncbi:hypothetical protein L484_002005 [Morus notabilis]|uniref:Uncharacterized protein n=1 Tax=Morus notabilis TaxID=981085 RepID=W9RSH8_9ROSA|nr:hypothetical protein L484_002005 [Morus notabilis]